MRLAKLRPLSEFAGKSSRFQLPDPRQQDRWGNRVVQNMLYYQTNYFILSAFIVLIFLLADPAGFVCGSAVTAVVVGIGVLAAGGRRAQVARAVESRPIVACAVGLACLIVLLYCLRAVAAFLLAVLIPALICLLHASLRLRNVSSKVSNRLRSLRSQEDATPMEYLLAWLDVVVVTEELDL